MIRVLTDNDFDGRVVTGMLRRRPGFDLVRVQDVGLAGVPDPDVLAWAAAENRVVATRDKNTMVGFALARVAAGETMPGLIVVAHGAATGAVIDDLLMMDDVLDHAELAGRVEYLPY